MFTGIIEEVGTIASLNGRSLCISAGQVLKDTKVGDSIAVNGICLTVTELGTRSFCADVMPETIRRTSLMALHPGSHVNLERALLLTSRLGGHLVSGHIDGTGIIQSIREEKEARVLQITTGQEILRYIIGKGSVALDGVSLTVASLTDTAFFVSLIPHTRQQTILHEKKIGDRVNIENDLVGKYVEKLLYRETEPESEKTSGLTRDWLEKYGF